MARYADIRRFGLCCWAIVAAALVATASVHTAHAQAEEDAAEPVAADQPPVAALGEGRLIRVRLPLVGNADAHIKNVIARAVAQLSQAPRRENRRPTLILELVPARRHAGYGEGTNFERALSLARYLTSDELSGVKTVAYIPQSIKGHGVLLALACEEIVMDPNAEIGEAGIDEDQRRAVSADIISSYQHIASRRKTVPEAIALGMLDRRLEVLRVETDQAIEFVLRSELESLERDRTIVSQETLVAAGSPASLTGREGREYGFVRFLANDSPALARGLALPPDAVVEDQSLVGDWRPVMINIDGPITRRTVRRLETLIGTELKDREVNWIGLRIDSPGGELEDCLRLAGTLAELDPNEVQTVAYVPVEAGGGAALVALACQQLVMHPDAQVGGQGTIEHDRATLDAVQWTLRESLARNTDHSWSLLAAMVDPDIELFSYRNTQTGQVRYFSPAEAAEQEQPDDWQRGAALNPEGELLRLSSNQARELEVASQVVANYDELKQLYGFETDPRVAVPNWALELVEALASPALAVLLIVIGFVGIYIELHTPGIGVGAFVAALAFMLFFWSNYLHGTAGWLEVLLFLGGVFFVLLELLVLPGFGIFGLGGGLMILASLVLASQTFVLPRTESQLAELRHSLTIVAAATACIVITALALRRFLPQTPVFRTLMLHPPGEADPLELDFRETVADFSHLVGQQGRAVTNLMPAGKAEFDGQLVDVIAEGMPIDRGHTIVVTKARGNRVLVRTVDV